MEEQTDETGQQPKRRRLLLPGETCGIACFQVPRFNCIAGNKKTDANPRTDAVIISNRELELLSEEEKAKLHAEIYGTSLIDDDTEETEEFILDKLQQLDDAIEEIKNTKLKKAYYAAIEQEEEQGTHYVRSRKFRLMFLRADKFHVQNAALRLVRFFTEKLKLFGISKLARPIKQIDLDEYDKEVLYSGYILCDKNIDMYGRPVNVLRRQNLVFHDIVNLKRAIIYWMQSLVENDEKAQKTGIVFVSYNVGFIDHWNSDFRRVFPQLKKLLYNVLPFKVACYHQCYSQTTEHVVSSFIVFTLPKDYKVRFKLHFGSHEKCQSELSTYGINLVLFPIALDGTYKFEQLHARLEELNAKENEYEMFADENEENKEMGIVE